jgi:hypothetical protein
MSTDFIRFTTNSKFEKESESGGCAFRMLRWSYSFKSAKLSAFSSDTLLNLDMTLTDLGILGAEGPIIGDATSPTSCAKCTRAVGTVADSVGLLERGTKAARK